MVQHPPGPMAEMWHCAYWRSRNDNCLMQALGLGGAWGDGICSWNGWSPMVSIVHINSIIKSKACPQVSHVQSRVCVSPPRPLRSSSSWFPSHVIFVAFSAASSHLLELLQAIPSPIRLFMGSQVLWCRDPRILESQLRLWKTSEFLMPS